MIYFSMVFFRVGLIKNYYTMGFLDWINTKIIQPVFRPLFGGKTGSLTPMTTQIAKKATGGETSITGILDNLITKNGLVNSLDYALSKAPQAIDEIAQKASRQVSKIPIIGGALSAEIEKAGGMVKGSLESAKDYKTAIPSLIDNELNITGAGKAILQKGQQKVSSIPLVGSALSKEVGKAINTVDEMREKLHGPEKQAEDMRTMEGIRNANLLSPTIQ